MVGLDDMFICIKLNNETIESSSKYVSSIENRKSFSKEQ